MSRRSLAVEPMTCPPNAFRSGEDLVQLEPGQSFTSSWGIDPGDTLGAMIDIDSVSFLVVVLAGAVAAFVAGLVSTPHAAAGRGPRGPPRDPDRSRRARPRGPDAFLDFFSNLGLGMLFFFAGYEIDFERIRGSPLRLAVLGWLLSLVLAYSLGGLLTLTGLVLSLLFTGSALATTAIGTLIPVLSDAGELRTRFGTYLLAAGAVGEFGPILLITLVFSTKGAADERADPRRLRRRGGAAAVMAVRGVGRGWALLDRTLETSGQLAIRIAVVMVFALGALAASLGPRPAARRLRGGRDRAPRAAGTRGGRARVEAHRGGLRLPDPLLLRRERGQRST